MKLLNKLLVASSTIGACLPIVITTSCNKYTGIGAPNVTCDQQDLKASLKYGESATFTFSLSKDIPSGMSLDKVFFTRTESEQLEDSWIFIDTAHPTITNKKFKINFNALRTYTEQKPTKTTGILTFVFKNSKGEERRNIGNFEFTYKE